jgi:tetratricopeptide (TPR) repeat protein
MFFRAWLRDPRIWGLLVLAGLVVSGIFLFSPRLQAWYHYCAARRDLECFHNPQAVRHLHVCLGIFPEDADTLLLAARAARRARAYQDAEHCLDKYQQIRGCDQAYSFEQLLLGVELKSDQADYRCWRYVEEDHPQTTAILDALVRGYLRQFRLKEAQGCLQRWLETEPDSAQALCLEGQFYLEYVFNKDSALHSYRRAVQLDPEHEEARIGLALALLDISNYAQAAEHLDYICQHQPDNLNAVVGLAECRKGLGQTEAALQLVQSVLARQPQFAPALSLRGRLAMDKGQFAEAETWLRQALALDLSDHNSRYQLIMCLRHSGKLDEAQKLQQELNRLESDLERFNEIVTKELPKSPLDPALHCALGQLLLRGGKRDEGLRWLRSALRLDPQYAAARQVLNDHYQKAAPEQHRQN